jgi:hypothetical protein
MGVSVFRDQTEIKPNGGLLQLRAFCSYVTENGHGLLTVTFDVNTRHHELAARKIMAALSCRRVRTHAQFARYRPSHQIAPIIFFSPWQSWGHVRCHRHKPL